MEGTTAAGGAPSEKRRISPRRAALLVAPVAGAVLGASDFPGVLLLEFWPERYGGDQAGFLAFYAFSPLILIIQSIFLTAIFRTTELPLAEAFRGLKASSWGDTFFVIVMFGLMLSGLAATLLPLIAVVPGDFWRPALAAARTAPLLALMFPISWLLAKAAAHPLPAAGEGMEALEQEDWQHRVRPVRLYLAWLANLCLAGPPLVWLSMDVWALPTMPVFGAMVGASLGVVFGIGIWTPAAAGARLLAGALFVGDLAATAVSLPVAWALHAYGLAEDNSLYFLATVAGFAVMAALAGLAVKRELQRMGTQDA